jgi:hypothetical protein
MALPILKPKNSAAALPDDPLAQFEAESASSMHGGSSVAAGPLAADPLAAGPLTAGRSTAGPWAARPLIAGPSAAGSSTAGRLAASTPAPEFDTPLGAIAPSELLALETVLERRISVSWLEAVAIVEATCAALVSDGEELPAPDPSDILLTAEGGIEVRTRFGFGRSDSVQRLARTLHTLTSGQAIPAPLRLFTSKWIGSEGNDSIADFAKELAYFARPNGSDLIREVYLRCAAAPVTKKRTTAASMQEPENQAEKKSLKVSPKPAKRSRAPLVIAVFSLAFALAIGIIFSRPSTGEAGSSDLLTNLRARAAEFARSLGDVRTQLGNLSAQLTAHLASGADKPAAEKPTPKTVPTTSSRARGNTPTSTAPSGASPLPARTLPGIATRSTAGSSGAASAPVLDLSALRPPDAGRPESPLAAPIAAPPAETVDPEAIYTSADEGISPPKMLYPQLPPPPLVISGSNDNVNVMEIVIGGDGSVERVKLVSPPRRLTDMMLLSGAKSWRFAPASKNGLPVRYRMAFSWATTP